jgi:glycosyltransferase involved in cell wall biosynthesis
MAPSITVLMPVYNAGKYLTQAVDSILNQTFTDFEFLIIDDGSTDNSVEIIKSYSDRRIRLVINEQNLGISATLNKGIELSSCELVARMDADDISYPERLKKQFDYFLAFPETVMLSTSVRFIDNENKSNEVQIVDHFFNCYFINFICAQYHPTIMYKRSVVIGHGGYKMRYSEDFDLWWRLMAANLKIGHLNEILLDYRNSDNSLSKVLKNQEYEDSAAELLRRNLRHYAGDSFAITDEEQKFFRHQYEPLLNTANAKAIRDAFRKLEYINQLIFNKPNVNYSSTDLAPQAELKKSEAFHYYYVKLPRLKAFRLLFSIYPPNESIRRILSSVKRKIKR